MALITKKYLTEQVRSLLGGGTPSAGAKFSRQIIESHLQQSINRHLKAEYFTVTLPGDETIPDGLVLASYDSIPVEKYKGFARAMLPAMPVSLRRNMGVWFVGPSVVNLNLATPVLTATVAMQDVVLTWLFVPHGTSYHLQRATDAGFTTGLVDIYFGDALAFTDVGLDPSTTYYYRLKAEAHAYTDSSYGYAQATTQMLTLGTPVLSDVANTTTSIDLVWVAVSNATNYSIERATDAAFLNNLANIYSGGGLSFTDTGLTASTIYYYRITATATGFLNSAYGYADAVTATPDMLMLNGTEYFLINSTDKLLL